jgi:hypothetical protein
VELNEKGAGLSPPAKENEPNGAAAIDPLAGAEAAAGAGALIVGFTAPAVDEGKANAGAAVLEEAAAGVVLVVTAGAPKRPEPVEGAESGEAEEAGVTRELKFAGASSVLPKSDLAPGDLPSSAWVHRQGMMS